VPVAPSGHRTNGVPGVQIVDLFLGNVLNAVDAKGRVSLPSSYRGVIERRQQRLAAPGGPVPDKLVTFLPHPRRTCLIGFDASYAQVILASLEKRVEAIADADPLAEMQDAQMAAFSDTVEVSYDPGGRMVLPSYLRDVAGIGDLAYFVAGGQMFEVWDPETFRREREDLKGAQRQLASFLADRAK
jgi:MraZ protein